MNEKYTKVVYQSEPIGKEKIVLYLTTFDLEAFEKDEKLEKIPIQKRAVAIEFEKHDLLNVDFAVQINTRLKKIVENVYKEQLEQMKSYIEINRKLPKAQRYKEGD